jgi:Na+/melibiose symporter-like transporter
MQFDHRWMVIVPALGAIFVVLLFFEALSRWFSRRSAIFQGVVIAAIAGVAVVQLASAPEWRWWLMAILVAVPVAWLALRR